ncbi:hypothetical protein K439DRAFT_1370009 [Ramaria rubella]|nr:hypothetical protein K439DRAFT_1370009 [Ramaria rubella]
MLPNPSRAHAGGKKVYSVPLWLYCDDTSGNVSKKWIKLISLLFTLAGLLKKMTQLAYNVHFLGTSNVMGPLELLEQVVSDMTYVAMCDSRKGWLNLT